MNIIPEHIPLDSTKEVILDEKLIDLEFLIDEDERQVIDRFWNNIYTVLLDYTDRTALAAPDVHVLNYQLTPSGYSSEDEVIGVVIQAFINANDDLSTVYYGPATWCQISTDGTLTKEDGTVLRYSDAMQSYVRDLFEVTRAECPDLEIDNWKL